MFLIFHDFQFSCHILCPTVDISKFSTFFIFSRIFHVLNSVFLIFSDFQFSRHILGPTVSFLFEERGNAHGAGLVALPGGNAANAAAVLAVGTCAAYGGIPAGKGNETGAMGVSAFILVLW